MAVERFRDVPDERDRSGWFGNMFREGLPLFVNAFLIMSILNEPKMVIDTAIAQGEMSADGVQYFVYAGIGSESGIYRVPSDDHADGDRMEPRGKPSFFENFGKDHRVSACDQHCIDDRKRTARNPVLSIVYAVDLSAYKSELLVIMVGGCVYTFAAVLDNALVVLRRQYVLVIAYALTWIYIKLTAAWLVGEWAVMGASLAYCTAMAVYLLLTAVLFVSSYRRKSGEV